MEVVLVMLGDLSSFILAAFLLYVLLEAIDGWIQQRRRQRTAEREPGEDLDLADRAGDLEGPVWPAGARRDPAVRAESDLPGVRDVRPRDARVERRAGVPAADGADGDAFLAHLAAAGQEGLRVHELSIERRED